MVSRALSDRERDLQGFPIARDGVAIVVHKDNPVRALTNQQIRDIYTGRTTRWISVGGADAAIAVVSRQEGRGSSDLFTDYFDLEYGEIRAQLVAGDNASALTAVADRPEAIVYVSVGEAERRAQAGAPLRLLSLDGVEASS
jgi:phosphate transport system substrate-binding protein